MEKEKRLYGAEVHKNAGEAVSVLGVRGLAGVCRVRLCTSLVLSR